jgi:hypothetical protein
MNDPIWVRRQMVIGALEILGVGVLIFCLGFFIGAG